MILFDRFLLFLSFILISMISSSGQNCSCKYTVPSNSHEIDGNKLNILPGDTICLTGDAPYRNLRFSSLKGSKEKPIIIRNCGGAAKVNSEGSYGVKFSECSFFKITGSGVEGLKYGISITTAKGFYLTMENFSTNFEISFIEIAGAGNEDTTQSDGFAGIGVKTKPYCDGSANRGTWTMKNVKIHDNYIHDTGGEGLYVGHGFYNGRIEKGCTDTTYSHSIEGLQIYNNNIENVGYDGIQVKNADKECEIHHNVIKNYGTKNHGAHNEGIFIGEGTTGKVYNNWIENGTGNGIQFQGIGNNDFFNNVIIKPQGYGFYAAGGKHVFRLPDYYVRVYNNTFINPGKFAFLFYGDNTGTKEVVNNIFVTSAQGFSKKGAKVLMSNNIITSNGNDLKFKDIKKNNFELTSTSPALNTGKNLSKAGVTFDYKDLKRPFQNHFDIGAFEYVKP